MRVRLALALLAVLAGETADECLRVSGDPTEFQRMIGQLPSGDDDGSG